MAISKDKKAQILASLKESFETATAVSFTKSNALTVEEVSTIRSDLRNVGGKMVIAKKTLIKLAFKEVNGQELTDEMLDGQIAVVFSSEDTVAPMGAVNARMKEFNTKDQTKIEFVGSFMDGTIQDAEMTTKLAGLPSRDVLLAKFMGSLMSPVSGLARFFDGAKTKMEEVSGKTVADLIEASATEEKAAE